jgi:hypothetical protein
MRPTNGTTAHILLPAIVGLGCVLITLGAVNAIAAMTHLSPHIGDIISFSASATQPAQDGTRLIVHRQDQFGCVLDLNVLRQSGGSLVVESQDVMAGGFSVHWAGERTAADGGNCGDSSDLILDRRELDILALGAGGYGTGLKRLPVVVNESGV